MSAYWRIRLNAGTYGDLSRRAWERDEVGVWYGMWTVADYNAAFAVSPDNQAIAKELSELPLQKESGWAVPSGYVATMKRFLAIAPDDWVFVYLRDTREIGVAKADGEVISEEGHPLNMEEGEYFKFRKLTNKKTFSVSELPDAYRLLPSQGQGNVFQFVSMLEHAKLLAESADFDALNKTFREKPFDVLLDLLGASAWESFAFAYLIWEEGFTPTGLSVGKTLPTVDIIGRRKDGSRILAQCKKNPRPIHIDEEFLKLGETLSQGDTAFYFAYMGCARNVPLNIRVIDRNFVLAWSKTANGKLYRRLLVGDGSV